jgi:hypothetical protein
LDLGGKILQGSHPLGGQLMPYLLKELRLVLRLSNRCALIQTGSVCEDNNMKSCSSSGDGSGWHSSGHVDVG